MHKVIDSIKKRPINPILMLISVALYFVNNFYIKPNTSGVVHVFFVSFFNDILCPLLFLGYSNMLLITVGKEITKLWMLVLFCFFSGCIWEFVAPLLKKGAITDYCDLNCYVMGAVIYWCILKFYKKRYSSND